MTKSLRPDMAADSIGGQVNVKTKDPLDYGRRNLNLNTGYGFNTLGGGAVYNLQGTYSDIFADGRWAFLLSGSRYSNDKVTDNIESRFEIASEDKQPGREDRFWSREVHYRMYTLVRENTGLTGHLSFRPNDNHEFAAKVVFSEFSDYEERDYHDLDFDRDISGYADTTIGNTPVKGEVIGVSVDGNFNARTDVENVVVYSLTGESSFDSGLKLDYSVSTARSESSRQPPNAYPTYEIDELLDRPTVVYDYTDPDFPMVELYETVELEDGAYGRGERIDMLPIDKFEMVSWRYMDELGETDESSFKIDAEIPSSLGDNSGTWKFGALASLKEAELNEERFTVEPEMLEEAGIAVPSYRSFLMDSQETWDSKGEFPLPPAILFDSSKSQAILEDLRSKIDFERGLNYIEDFYNVKEDVYAAYAMNTMEFGKLTVIGGVRMEHVRQESSGFVLTDGDEDDPNAYELNTFKTDYTDYFPSLHLNYRMSEDKVVRVAFNSGISRAPFSRLRPNASIDDINQSISGGNPTIDPTTSLGLDVYYEQYFGNRGFFSFGLFYKDIEDPMFSTVTTVDSTAFNSDGVDRRGYRYSTLGNGSDGEIYGYEIGIDYPLELLLPDPWGGFGVRANYTYSKDSALTPETEFVQARETGLSGSSRHTANLGVYYEANNFTGTLSYQYRSRWLNSLNSDQEDGRLDRYWDTRPSLDLSLSYAFSENMSVYLEANNLSEEYGRRIYDDRSRVYEVEGFGKTFLSGVKWNF